MSYAISIRIPDATMDRLRSLCERLNLSTTDAILNAIELELEMLSTTPRPTKGRSYEKRRKPVDLH